MLVAKPACLAHTTRTLTHDRQLGTIKGDATADTDDCSKKACPAEFWLLKHDSAEVRGQQKRTG